MARKEIELDPRTGNARCGLMITRGFEHAGHAALKAQMVFDNSRNIIGFGSSEKSRTHDNPLSPDQKRRAQMGVWGDAFKMVFLQDLGTTDRSTDWADYVFDRIRTNQLPEPTDFYAGSIHEARWYTDHFADLNREPSFQRGNFDVYENPHTGKRIHILDRTKNIRISASEVRTMIEQRNDEWKTHVSAKLWDFYEWEYPPELRTAVVLAEGSDLPPAGAYPVGTKLIIGKNPTVLILRDDGRWRPRTAAESGKSLGD